VLHTRLHYKKPYKRAQQKRLATRFAVANKSYHDTSAQDTTQEHYISALPKSLTLQKSPTKEPYNRDRQKSPTKEPYKRALQKSPTKEPYNRDRQKSPTKELYNRALQKSPTKETYNRD